MELIIFVAYILWLVYFTWLVISYLKTTKKS